MRCTVSILLFLGLTFTSCVGQKNAANNSETELTNLRCYTQKVFPGVSGEIVHFVQYRIEFDLKTNTAVDFRHLQVGGRELPIQSVRSGNKIINTHLGEYLESDADNVTLSATLPMRQSDIVQTESEELIHPGKVSLVYTTNDNQHAAVIENIVNEPDQFRPAAPRDKD